MNKPVGDGQSLVASEKKCMPSGLQGLAYQEIIAFNRSDSHILVAIYRLFCYLTPQAGNMKCASESAEQANFEIEMQSNWK